MRPLIACGLVATLLLAGRQASANTCSFGTVGGINFGTYHVFATGDVDVTGSFVFTCSSTAVVTIDMGPGGGTITDRTMASGANKLHYQLYTDITRLLIWGDTTGGNRAQATPLLGLPTTQFVYARLFALQNVPVASDWADSVLITINY